MLGLSLIVAASEFDIALDFCPGKGVDFLRFFNEMIGQDSLGRIAAINDCASLPNVIVIDIGLRLGDPIDIVMG